MKGFVLTEDGQEDGNVYSTGGSDEPACPAIRVDAGEVRDHCTDGWVQGRVKRS